MKNKSNGFGKKEVYANPPQYEYTKLNEVSNYMYLQDGENNQVITTSLKLGKEASSFDLEYAMKSTQATQIAKYSISDIKGVRLSSRAIS